MKESGGSIVNMASVSSWLPVDGYAGYSATKAAVASLTRTVALHCRKNGFPVRVNSLHPDGIYTPMMQASAPGVPAEIFVVRPQRPILTAAPACPSRSPRWCCFWRRTNPRPSAALKFALTTRFWGWDYDYTGLPLSCLRVRAVVDETHDTKSLVFDVPPELANVFPTAPGNF